MKCSGAEIIIKLLERQGIETPYFQPEKYPRMLSCRTILRNIARNSPKPMVSSSFTQTGGECRQHCSQAGSTGLSVPAWRMNSLKATVAKECQQECSRLTKPWYSTLQIPLRIVKRISLATRWNASGRIVFSTCVESRTSTDACSASLSQVLIKKEKNG